jgi:GT2 family glycosyltransferase/glycosyltransferase involved in cell wall biosynthesis/SAM-dependent methyltransferase
MTRRNAESDTPTETLKAPHLVLLAVPAPQPDTVFTGERFVPGLSGEIELEHLHRYLVAAALCRGRDVLDVACGEGYGGYILSQVARSVVGVDVAADVIARARVLYPVPNLRFETGSCLQLPQPDGSVDVVVSFETIEHIREHEEFLKEVRRVLRPTGILVLSTPDREEYNQQMPAPNPYHLRELSKADFFALLRSHFAHVEMSLQRVMYGSAVAADESSAGAGRALVFAHQTEDRRVSFTPSPRHATYLISVCGDGVVPELPNGFYEGTVKPNHFSALQGGIVERDQEIIRLRETVIERDASTARHFSALQGGIVERDQEIIRLRETVIEREASIARLGKTSASWQDAVAMVVTVFTDHVDSLQAAVQGSTASLAGEQCQKALDIERLRIQVESAEGESQDSVKRLLAGRIATLTDLCARARACREEIHTLREDLFQREETVRSHTAELEKTRAHLTERQATVGSLQHQLASVQSAYDGIRHSRAFRITYPLRLVGKAVHKILRLSRRVPMLFGRHRDRVQAGTSKSRQSARVIARSGLFDCDWYFVRYPDVAANWRDPVLHYLAVGASERRDPHPLFDTAYYLEKYPDVVAAGVNPLEHFLTHGFAEGRDPHPLFDTAHYLEKFPDVAAGVNPLAHFLTHGFAEGRDPHPLFDTAYYLKKYPDVAAAGVNPLVHFVTHGFGEGRDPHPLFDTAYYLEKYPDVAAGVNPLVHFVTHGFAEGRDPHPLFDTAYYLKKYPDVAAAGMNPLLHFLTHGFAEGRDPHPLFDTAYYLKKYPDVAAAGMNPLLHFLTWGFAEGRDPHPLFDTAYYCEQNPDVAATGVNPLTHYLREALANPLIRPSERFDPAFYLATLGNVDLGETPLVHFVSHFDAAGRKEWTEAELSALVKSVRDAEPAANVENSVPLVSIIIPVHNQLGFTLQCLRSLRNHSTRYRIEVLVIDDCSKDATSKVLPTLDWVRYLRNETNEGFLRSCNTAAAQAQGDYLVLLNNDTVVLPGWLDELIDTFAQVPEAGLVGSKLLYPSGTLQEAGGIIWCDATGWNYGRGDPPNKPEYNYLREVDYCSGASIAIPRRVWDKLGGFDTAFVPAYYEDTDLAFRVRASGYKVLYQPFSSLVHFEGVSCGTDLASGVKSHQVRNAKTFARRHAGRLSSQGHYTNAPHRERDRGTVGRILFIDSCTPTPDQDAGSQVAHDLILTFQQAGYQTTFVADNLHYVPRYTEYLQRLGVHCLYAPYTQSIQAHLAAVGKDYDMVVIFRAPVLAKYADAIRTLAPQAKVVFHTVDLHYLREEREAALRDDAQMGRRIRWSKGMEQGLILGADCTIVVSRHEQELLAAELPTANVVFLPYIIEARGSRASFAERSGLMFVGGYRHMPNVDAVLYFVREVFPLVRARLPEVRFLILGSHLPQELKELNELDGVDVIGYVPDLDPYLNRCRINVAPLRYGAGIKGKVVMSLSRGLPSVVSSVAAEGMGLRHGEEVLIADDPATNADLIVELYTNQSLWERISAGGPRFVQDNYSGEVARGRVREILKRIGLQPAGKLSAEPIRSAA